MIDVHDITAADAQAAGARRRRCRGRLANRGTLYRIRFHRVGEVPAHCARERSQLDGREPRRPESRRRQARLGTPVLRLIAERPGVVSTKLARELGLERLVFKQRVRRLKALGLTESLTVGYRRTHPAVRRSSHRRVLRSGRPAAASR